MLALLVFFLPCGDFAVAGHNDGVRDAATPLKVPGISIAVVSGESVDILNIGVLRAGQDEQIDGDTVFQAGSLGKPLFAYGLMLLVQDGRLDLDLPLSSYESATRRFGPPLDTLTTRQLLAHFAGLPPSFRGSEPYLERSPGTDWAYSGQGYRILQTLAESITGQGVEAWMQSAVLRPLGMNDSHFVLEGVNHAELAAAHDRNGQPIDAQAFDEANVASSLYTTSSDYARFLQVLLDPEHRGPLGGQVAAQMFRPQIVVDEPRGLFWGLGWALQPENGPWIFHWASNPGFKALAAIRPDQDLAIVYFSNGDNGLELADEILQQQTGLQPGFLDFYMLHPDD